LEVFEVIAPGEQEKLWEAFVDRGMQIKVILSERRIVPIKPFTFK
jgi:hypothetical protein